MLSTIHSVSINGLQATRVLIEVNLEKLNAQRDPFFVMVGLPDNAVKESRTRVRTALQNSGYHIRDRYDVAVNFAPADVKKEGSGFDLPLAIGQLCAAADEKPAFKAVAKEIGRYVFLGELGLNGELRPVRGVLLAAILARKMGYEGIFVPADNAREAAVVDTLKVYGAQHLGEVIEHLTGVKAIAPTVINTREVFYAAQNDFPFDFSEVKGQENVKRAFEIAAAGGHNIILIGSPGCGKSMMAKRMPSILPPLTLHESLETTQIHSIAGKLKRQDTLIAIRPFQSPHHTISDVALIGGGTNLQPGEISLAHNGVLFLDEFPEFSKKVLETLRQPLEDRQITISRAKYTTTLPCSFMLVAAMNPCPCGYLTDPSRRCTCTEGMVQRYRSRVSGPLLDRIDLQIDVVPVPIKDLSEAPAGESSEEIRKRVVAARQIQEKRFKDCPGIHCNAQMTEKMLQQYATPGPEALEQLRRAMERLQLSARAYSRILKVARTIADLEGAEVVSFSHISEAISYRILDRGDWAER